VFVASSAFFLERGQRVRSCVVGVGQSTCKDHLGGLLVIIIQAWLHTIQELEIVLR